MSDTAFLAFKDKLSKFKSMNVGSIEVKRVSADEVTLEMKDDGGWVMHSIGPIRLGVGHTLTFLCPKEKTTG